MPTTIPGLPSTIPMFQGRASTTQTFATANSYASIDLQTEDYDDDNGHSTSTNISRYVAQRAGRFIAQGAVLYANGQATTGGTTLRVARLYKNGTSAIPGTICYGTYTGLPLTLVTPLVIFSMSIGDYVEVKMYSSLASTQTVGDVTDGSVLRVDFVR